MANKQPTDDEIHQMLGTPGMGDTSTSGNQQGASNSATAPVTIPPAPPPSADDMILRHLGQSGFGGPAQGAPTSSLGDAYAMGGLPTDPASVGTSMFPPAKPGPQSWGDIFTHTYSADLTDPQLYKDIAAKFGQGAAYDLGPQALRAGRAGGLDVGMSPEDLQRAQEEAANRLGPMSPIIKGAGYSVSPITKLVGAPLGALTGGVTNRIAAPAIEAAAPYVPKAVSAAADYLPEGAANWLKSYARQLPSSIPNAVTQSTLTSALSGYGNAPTLTDIQAGGRAAWDAVTNPLTYAGGLIPGGRRMLPSDARTAATDLMGDTQYGGVGANRVLKTAVDAAREDVMGKGASSGVAAPDVSNLVDTFHWGLPTNAKDIQNVIDEVNAKGGASQSPIEKKMADAYSSRLSQVFNEPAISGGNPAQVQAARNITKMTDQPLTAPPPRNPLADLLGLPAGATTGLVTHYFHPDPRVSVPVGVASTAWPYIKDYGQKAWNATSKLNALQPEVNTMYQGEGVSPHVGNALLNLMLSGSRR